jgi:hypothetical protein
MFLQARFAFRLIPLEWHSRFAFRQYISQCAKSSILLAAALIIMFLQINTAIWFSLDAFSLSLQSSGFSDLKVIFLAVFAILSYLSCYNRLVCPVRWIRTHATKALRWCFQNKHAPKRRENLRVVEGRRLIFKIIIVLRDFFCHFFFFLELELEVGIWIGICTSFFNTFNLDL